MKEFVEVSIDASDVSKNVENGTRVGIPRNDSENTDAVKGGGDIKRVAQEDQNSSTEKASLLAKEIKFGAGSGKLSKLIKAFALGATLIAGNPAQADVVPDAPKLEAAKKDEQIWEHGEKIIGQVVHPTLGRLVVEVLRRSNPDSDGSVHDDKIAIRINDEELPYYGAMNLRGPGVIYSVGGYKHEGGYDSIRFFRGKGTFFTRDGQGNKIELPFQIQEATQF